MTMAPLTCTANWKTPTRPAQPPKKPLTLQRNLCWSDCQLRLLPSWSLSGFCFIIKNQIIFSLYTLPDEMPPAFASSYTPIGEAGSDAQKQHLARMMAIQMTRKGEGPGIEYIKAEKQKQFMEKQAARSEGAAGPSTAFAGTRSEKEKQRKEESFLQPEV